MSKPFSFGKEYHLKKRKDFEILYKTGKRLVSSLFLIYYLPGKLKISRLGLSIRKSVGCSVERNRYKRIIRETFRKLKTSFNNNYDMIIIIKKSERDNSALFKDLEGLLKCLP